MQKIFVDVETYYDKDYSLRRMTPIEYIKDPRFECIGWAVSRNGLSGFMEEDEFREFLFTLRGKRIAMISHNALFDMSVLAQRFDYTPDLMIDTLGMARAMWGHKYQRLSLEILSLQLGLGVKGDVLPLLSGMSKAAIIQAGLWNRLKAYAVNDSDLCEKIYHRAMDEGFPASEILVMDNVLRCAVNPQFQIDRTVLAEHLAITQQGKEQLLAACGMNDRDALMSNEKFAAALRNLGVTPPLKRSLLTGNQTYAFAKTDLAFQALEEHPDPRVQTLVSARLGLKSTIEETRTQRMINIANLAWDGEPLMPIPLKYAGAHTHRLSGDWRINMQNLPRGGKLRNALLAPPDLEIVVADAAQIEARGVAVFCGQANLVQAFKDKLDVYSMFASEVFGKPVNKRDNPIERFIGKTGILGLGYGVGAPKFQDTIKTSSKNQTGTQVDMSDLEASNTVKKYRELYPCIPAMWRTLDKAIPMMTDKKCFMQIGPIKIEFGRIVLPNGLTLNYPNLRREETGWVFTYAGKTKHLYGAKLLENIIQALSRLVVMETATRIRVNYQHKFVMQVHDELAYLVPRGEGESFKNLLITEMSVPPTWMPDWPLAAEGEVGRSYGEAK